MFVRLVLQRPDGRAAMHSAVRMNAKRLDVCHGFHFIFQSFSVGFFAFRWRDDWRSGRKKNRKKPRFASRQRSGEMRARRERHRFRGKFPSESMLLFSSAAVHHSMMQKKDEKKRHKTQIFAQWRCIAKCFRTSVWLDNAMHLLPHIDDSVGQKTNQRQSNRVARTNQPVELQVFFIFDFSFVV